MVKQFVTDLLEAVALVVFLTGIATWLVATVPTV